MLKRFTAKIAPLTLALGIGGALVALGLPGCGSEDVDSVQQQLLETKAATVVQADFNSFLTAVNLKSCTFVIAGGTGTFTPSSELSQVLYGDPNGSAHKLSFSVPPIGSGGATIDITSFEAEMATTGITLSGANATVKLAFHGQLHVNASIPIFGKVAADVQIKSSSISIVLGYDAAAERVRVTSVTSKIVHTTKNCGGSGWCNGIVDGILNSNLDSWINAPLQSTLNDAFDNDGTAQDLQDLLTIMYNRKDPSTPAWTMVPHTLSLASSAFKFNVQR